jgi:hypothetical protein
MSSSTSSSNELSDAKLVSRSTYDFIGDAYSRNQTTANSWEINDP